MFLVMNCTPVIQGIFVSVVNPMLINDFGGNTLRKAKTNKKDAVKIASYALNYWIDLKQSMLCCVPNKLLLQAARRIYLRLSRFYSVPRCFGLQ